MEHDADEVVRRYLRTLEELRPGTTVEYFRGLRDEVPGAMAATVRNIEYGLRHFAPGLVIDLGCGHGLQAYAFNQAGREVVGIDQQAFRIELAGEAVKHLDASGISFEVGDARTVLDGRRAGAVWMHRSFHHLADIPSFLATAHRALAPGGTLVLVTSNARSRELLRFLPYVRPGRHRTRDLQRYLRDGGFEVEDVSYHGFLTALPLGRRVPFTASLDRLLARIPGVRTLAGSFSLTARAI